MHKHGTHGPDKSHEHGTHGPDKAQQHRPMPQQDLEESANTRVASLYYVVLRSVSLHIVPRRLANMPSVCSLFAVCELV
eukprot:360328-Chlamydomonas_euryale.AAC.20